MIDIQKNDKTFTRPSKTSFSSNLSEKQTNAPLHSVGRRTIDIKALWTHQKHLNPFREEAFHPTCQVLQFDRNLWLAYVIVELGMLKPSLLFLQRFCHCLLLVKFPFCKWVVCTLKFPRAFRVKGKSSFWLLEFTSFFVSIFIIIFLHFYCVLKAPFHQKISVMCCFTCLIIYSIRLHRHNEYCWKGERHYLVMAFKKELYGLLSALRIARPVFLGQNNDGCVVQDQVDTTYR